MLSLTLAAFGSWASPILSNLIVAASISLTYVLLDGDDVYRIEGRPQDRERYVLVRRHPQDATENLIPHSFNVGTRVHECSVGVAAVCNGVVCFSDYAGQRLYRLEPGKKPVPPIAEPPGGDAEAGLTCRSYYGVSDLVALARDRHKFKSHYLD